MTAEISRAATVDSRLLSNRKIHNVAQWLLRQCGVVDHNLSIRLVDDTEICRLNEQYRQKKGPTNVLSFPFGDDGDTTMSALPVRELGDIVISLDTASKEASEMHISLRDRVDWLLVHGVLHLLGYDHEISPKEEKRMFAREQELLTRLSAYRRNSMTKLAINVDHVATIRQARGITEPDPVTAAAICELAGAFGIVVHLREDRRHIQDRDVFLLRETVQTKLNLEMGANKEIIDIALQVEPDLVTLVPEKRQELTTEGGLDVVSQKKKLEKVIKKMTKAGIPVSLFVDPDPEQLAAANEIGATFVELHTGRYSDAPDEAIQLEEYRLIADAAEIGSQLGLRVCAGHGLNYRNTAAIAGIDVIEELSIGHAVIARAVFTGMDQAVREMLALVAQGDMLI